jgi:hypothetical protein
MPDGIARKSSSAAKALLGAELRIGVGQLTQRCRDNDTKSEVRNEKIERLNPSDLLFVGTVRFRRAESLSPPFGLSA